MPSASKSASKENLVALCAAVCLFLSSIEYIIPKPLPFMRLGLANLPVLIALTLLSSRYVFILIFLKIAGQALIHGSFLSIAFLFSFSGALASGLAMMAARQLLGKKISLIGISIIGAFTSNMVQILIARLLVFGENAWLIAPPFLLMGLLSSTLLGFIAQTYLNRSSWIKKLVL